MKGTRRDEKTTSNNGRLGSRDSLREVESSRSGRQGKVELGNVLTQL